MCSFSFKFFSTQLFCFLQKSKFIKEPLFILNKISHAWRDITYLPYLNVDNSFFSSGNSNALRSSSKKCKMEIIPLKQHFPFI